MEASLETLEIVRRFGERVRFLRNEKRLTQEELAERASVHRTYIGMIERGEKNATVVTIVKLSEALEVAPMELLREIERA